MSRTQKTFVIIFAAANVFGFIAWSMLMERIHVAPRQPLVATQQIVPLMYKGTTRFIMQRDDKLLRWSGGPWPLVIVFSEFAVLVWLGVRYGGQPDVRNESPNKSPERKREG
jgi:hypothetical protein